MREPVRRRPCGRQPSHHAGAHLADAGPEGVAGAIVQPGQGHLVVVACADAACLDVLLGAVGRHLGQGFPASVLQPIATRHLPAGGGVLLKPSSFQALERQGALVMTWEREGQQFGYPVSMVARLETGGHVIAGAPLEVVAGLRATWQHSSVVRIAAGTEPLRARLAAKEMFARAAGLGRVAEPAPSEDVRLADRGDVGLAIRMLAQAIRARLEAHQRTQLRPILTQGRGAREKTGMDPGVNTRRVKREGAAVSPR